MDFLIYLASVIFIIFIIFMSVSLFAIFLEEKGGKKSKIAADIIRSVLIYGFIIFVTFYYFSTQF